MSKLRLCPEGHELAPYERKGTCSACREQEMLHWAQAERAEEEAFLRNLREQPAPTVMFLKPADGGPVQKFVPGNRPDRWRRR